jgi:hypothetical protein
MALQVNGNVDSKIVKELRDFVVAFCPNLKELIERRYEPRSHLAAVIRAIRNTDHLEFGTIVKLDHFGHKMARRVTTKIGGSRARSPGGCFATI